MWKYSNEAEHEKKEFCSFAVDIDKYFNKKYQFNSAGTCHIPNTVVANKWSDLLLQRKKKILNDVKGQLNIFSLSEWSKHTKNRDSSSFIIKYLRKRFNPELLTQVGTTGR